MGIELCKGGKDGVGECRFIGWLVGCGRGGAGRTVRDLRIEWDFLIFFFLILILFRVSWLVGWLI